MKKRKIISKMFLFIFVLLFSFSNTISAATICATSGGLRYCVSDSTTGTRYKEIPGTRAWHTFGYITTINFSTTGSLSMQATSTVTGTVGISVAQVSASLGVSTTATDSWTAGVAYTIPETQPTAEYAIESVFPGSNVVYRTLTNDGELIAVTKNIVYAPKYSLPSKRLKKI